MFRSLVSRLPTFKIVIGLLAAAFSCAGAFAQWGTPTPSAAKSLPAAAAPVSLKDIDVLQKAVTDAWERMPLTVRRAIFVTEKAPMIGSWSERPSNVFKAGEKMITYVEPVGYTWKPRGDGFDFGVSADVVIKSSDGKILGGQEKFADLTLSNRMKLQEFMLNLTMSADGLSAGKYVLEYKLHDQGSEKIMTFDQPFTIAE